MFDIVFIFSSSNWILYFAITRSAKVSNRFSVALKSGANVEQHFSMSLTMAQIS